MCLHFFDEYFYNVLNEMRKMFRSRGMHIEKNRTIEELKELIKNGVDEIGKKPWAVQHLTENVLLLHDLMITMKRNGAKVPYKEAHG